MIDQLARDLTATFPDITGFTRLNFLYVRSFAEKWPEPEFVQQSVAQFPWGQNLLLTKLKIRSDREWYLARLSCTGGFET